MLLNQAALPLRDYHKAKRLIWDPQDLDFTQDIADWAAMSEREQSLLKRALALFLGGESAVTSDLSPLMVALKREGGHLEEEMFLTTQLFEEAKHVEFFDRVLREVVGADIDLASVSGASYSTLFTELDHALSALLTDHSAAAQANAVASYHMIVEGVLAETGYYGFFTALRAKGLMPATTRGLELLQRDESRHIAFGLHLLARHISADAGIWNVIETRLNSMMPLAQGVFMELLGEFLPAIPFDLDLNDLVGYAGGQFMARMNVLERARQQVAS